KIATPNYTVGLESNGAVVRAHRYLKFLLGKSDDMVRVIVAKNNWRASVVPDHAVDAVRHHLLGDNPVEGDVPVKHEPVRAVTSHNRFIQPTCCECGKPAQFGFGYSHQKQNKSVDWFCFEHKKIAA